MSGVSLPVTRPIGKVLIVGSSGSRAEPLGTLQRMGFGCAESDDPYHALAEICQRPLAYKAVILSLAGLYREELALISTVKQRLPHVEVWLTHIDGRQAALAEALRLGADCLLSDEGLHRMAVAPASINSRAHNEDSAPEPIVTEQPSDAAMEIGAMGEPVLSADELRALLEEQPSPPIGGEG